MNKLIGIDGNEANLRKRVGVNVYAFNLLWAIYKLEDKKLNNYKFIIYLADSPLPDMPPDVKNFWEYKVIPGGRFWILKKLMPYLWRNPDKIKVLFSPSHYTVPILPLPRISSIMDLGYLEFSEQFEKKVFWQLKWWSAISILVSKKIIAISQKTKLDILRHYPFASNKVTVIYPGYDPDKFYFPIPTKNVRQVKRKYKIGKNYILYLGTLKPSKNIEGLLKAFALIKDDFPDYFLVIAGKKGWLFDSIFEKVKKMGLQEKVIFTGFVAEEEKAPLMAGAKVFASPSFWEGFGLIALEAMACGTPVVVSDVASFPEVVGKAGILVNPRSVKSIAAGIKKVISASEKEYNEWVRQSLKQVKKFSWRKAAAETINLIAGLGNK